MDEALKLILVVVVIGLQLVCVVWGGINLKRAGHSPHLMWVTLIIPIAPFVIFPASLWLVHQQQLQDRQKADALRRRAEEEHVAAQRALSLRLNNLISDSTQTAATLPSLVQSAENTIDLAEQEFADGAFAPFWDVVEQAANKLASFEASIQQLIQNSNFYTGEAPKLQTPPPPFQLGLQTLPDASHTANRMRALVRRAQKDFHFASIYEQRKTNQLLVAGFSTLGQAINELGDRLDSSLERLASSVRIGISDIISTQERMTSTLAAELELSREQTEKELEMLDNIQRRRKPIPPGFRDGEY